MESLTFSMEINAPVKHVWHCMLDKPSYEERTAVFQEGSTYDGSWEKGSSMKFTDGSGEEGMLAEVAENRPYEFVSLKYLGEVMKDKETGELKTTMYPESGYEEYSFREADESTTVGIELKGLPEGFADMMNEMRPKALQKLKEVCEK